MDLFQAVLQTLSVEFLVRSRAKYGLYLVDLKLGVPQAENRCTKSYQISVASAQEEKHYKLSFCLCRR